MRVCLTPILWPRVTVPCLLSAHLTSSITMGNTERLTRLRYQLCTGVGNVYITAVESRRAPLVGHGCKMNYIFTMIIMLPCVAAKKRPIHLKIVNNQKQLSSHILVTALSLQHDDKTHLYLSSHQIYRYQIYSMIVIVTQGARPNVSPSSRLSHVSRVTS